MTDVVKPEEGISQRAKGKTTIKGRKLRGDQEEEGEEEIEEEEAPYGVQIGGETVYEEVDAITPEQKKQQEAQRKQQEQEQYQRDFFHGVCEEGKRPPIPEWS